MGEDGTAHKDGDLLNDFNACVPCLPTLFRVTDCFEERQHCRYSEGTGDDCEGSGSGVADILILMVYVGTHGGNHSGQAGSLRQVGDDFSALDSRVVVLIN